MQAHPLHWEFSRSKIGFRIFTNRDEKGSIKICICAFQDVF